MFVTHYRKRIPILDSILRIIPRKYSHSTTDWLYQNYDFSKQHILFLWKNKPAVVVGRHQNPWLEANTELAAASNVSIARRNSGGGAVFHDLENLNLSFFTSKESYNRKHNLEIIADSLNDEWGINCVINNREDITLNNKKISGTASKLSRANAYHHCTLLVDCNKKLMSTMLCSKNKNVVTNATRSVPSAVMNLRESFVSINVDRLMTVIGSKYLRTSPFTKSNSNDLTVLSKGFQFINPENFPGLYERVSEFKSWSWIFGRTPKFTIKNTVNLLESTSSSYDLDVYVEVEKGLVKNVDVQIPPSFLVFVKTDSMSSLTEPFLRKNFTVQLLTEVEETLRIYFNSKFEDPRLKSALL